MQKLQPCKDKNHLIDLDTIPNCVKEQAFLYEGHNINGNYVYGIKFVSQTFQDMFGANTYQNDMHYYYEDTKDQNFNVFCCLSWHTAGLWAFGLCADLQKEIEMNKNNTSKGTSHPK